MKTKRLSAIILTMVFAITGLIFHSCDKEDDNNPSNPSITSISPEIATEGSEITITGENFTNDVSKLTLTIGGISVIPISLTTTEIKFVVPEGLSIGVTTIIVKIDGCSADATVNITIESNTEADLWEWTKVGISNIEWFENEIELYNNKLWLIGGDRWDEVLNENHFTNNVYNSNDGIIWNIVTDHPAFTARALHQIVIFNNKLFLAGGVLENNHSASDVWSSSDGIEWVLESSDQFMERERFGFVEYNESLWVLGGGLAENHIFNNDTYKSIDGKNWENVILNSDNHPIGRSDIFTFVFEDKLWVVGGSDNDEDP
ncbi:MAG: hypothetical protein HKP62_07200, partial [Sulfurovum sp.]|nr:IPT/TIG domain-containing protein [Sulfurovum sp.]NNJ45786.1 hypothetical protein [Sulfurovum sp.]